MTQRFWMINTRDLQLLDRIWQLCQRLTVDMYRTRISFGQIGWVIEVRDDHRETRLLLEFSHCLSPLTGVYYR